MRVWGGEEGAKKLPSINTNNQRGRTFTTTRHYVPILFMTNSVSISRGLAMVVGKFTKNWVHAPNLRTDKVRLGQDSWRFLFLSVQEEGAEESFF